MDKRDRQRLLTLMTGQIISERISFPLACAILNISDVGACVLVPDAAVIPEVFTLVMDKTGSSRACSVRWKSKNRIGVSFQ